MNAVMLLDNQFLRSTNTALDIGRQIRMMLPEHAELCHLERMKTRSELRDGSMKRLYCLMQLRVKARRHRIEESRARSHWFGKVLPIYHAPTSYTLAPLESLGEEYRMPEENFERKNYWLVEVNHAGNN